MSTTEPNDDFDALSTPGPDFDQDWLDSLDLTPPKDLGEPTLWRVYIMPLPAPEKTAGGILLPGQSQEAQRWAQYIGKIVAMGPLCWKAKMYEAFKDEKLDFPAIGDLVIFAKNAPMRFEKDRKRIVCINDDEIIGRIDSAKGFKAYVM